jgi:tRNA wybutosine-synthesizing protein 2
VVTVEDVDDAVKTFEGGAQTKLVVFQMSNELAPKIVNKLREHAPPVRHVNLGLLPTSKGAWRTAVQCLCPENGGWLHVHENFSVNEIGDKAASAIEAIHHEVQDIHGENWHARLEHVEKVKTYAPGVMHCVLDIHVFPGRDEP